MLQICTSAFGYLATVGRLVSIALAKGDVMIRSGAWQIVLLRASACVHPFSVRGIKDGSSVAWPALAALSA
jgi:hypothetical protein